MKVASIQLNIAWENLQKNLKMAELYTKQAHHKGCDVIVFPEMFNSGFSMNISQTAERPHGKTFQFLSQLAKKYNINIIAGISELCTIENKGKAENVALIFNRIGKLEARYVKNHSFNLAEEGTYFIEGTDQSVFNVDGVTCSVFICYDLRFPEIFRKVAKKVDVMFIIANWPQQRHQHWKTLIQARAIENQCFIVAVNRTGVDGNNIQYKGGSQVIDPMGNRVSYGKRNQTCIISNIETSMTKSVRTKLPFIEDMKITR